MDGGIGQRREGAVSIVDCLCRSERGQGRGPSRRRRRSCSEGLRAFRVHTRRAPRGRETRASELDAERANLAAKHKSMLRRDLAWLARGARARRTKEKARVDRVEALKRQPIESAPREMEISLGSERLGKSLTPNSSVSIESSRA